MSARVCLIFNPHSGRNRRRPGFAAALRAYLRDRVPGAVLRLTEGPGHATELARAAVRDGAAVVVAVGGDGTMNEVAQGLLHTPAALGLVPCGSGNGLALHLGIPLAPFAALALAADPNVRIATVDTGVADGHPFCNAMGLGLDAEVSARFNRLTRRGLPAYVRVAWQTWRETRPERVTVATAGREFTVDARLVTVANSDQYGNQARIAPGAKVDDGRLDLVAVRGAGLLRTLALVPHLFLGTLERDPLVVRAGAEAFVIVRSAPGPIHTDGETHAAGTRIAVAVRPRSLRVAVPAGCRAVAPAAAAVPLGFALAFP